MAVVIAFGLAFGTILTLVVVPVIYSLFFGARYPGAAAPEPAAAEPAAAQ